MTWFTREREGRFRVEVLFPRSHKFTRDEEEAEELAKLTKQDLIDFYRAYIAPQAPNRFEFTLLFLFDLIDFS